MSDLTATLTEAASAVAALGACQADIDELDDASLQEGLRLVRGLEQAAQPIKLWLAAAIARRSDHLLDYDGLARKNGFATPAGLIQSLTESSHDDATKLARLGIMMVEAELVPEAGPDGAGGSGATAIATAATTGGISLACADAIRRGLGRPDGAVTDSQLREVAERLIAQANSASALGGVTPEGLLRSARRAREELDVAAVERGEKERSGQRYVRVWSRDGMSGGSWALPDEDGGIEVRNALKLLVANKTGGPRFADPALPAPDAVVVDVRTPEQVMADGFAQVFHNGITADPTVVPGAGRVPVRVIVTERVLADRATNGPGATPTGSGLLEDTMTAVSFGKLEEYLCEGGTIGIAFTENGQILDVGREQRLFTRAQRTALGVRDGGCRFPECQKPPSWCEAHHIDYWARDKGRTDTGNGILLCRYHHMLIHNQNWEIIRKPDTGDPGQHRPAGDYWVKPPRERDPEQKPIPMPSKNPLVAAMQHAKKTSPGFA